MNRTHRACATAVTAAMAALPTSASAQSPVYTVQANAAKAATSVYDPARGVVVTVEGGAGGRIWEWNGAIWRERMDVPTDSLASTYEAAAYDPAGSRTLWLRTSGSLSVDAWDGVRWTIGAAAALTFGIFGGAAFDPIRNRLVVLHLVPARFGISVAEWDGSNWLDVSPGTSPLARANCALAWDPTRSAVVCHGGSAISGAIGGTWAWDGTSFTPINSATDPGARVAASLCFDPVTNQMVLYGGFANGASLHDTWVLGAPGWTQPPTSTDPGPRFGAQLVHDGTGLLLLGGRVSSLNSLVIPTDPFWRWNGTAWQRLPVDGEPTGRRADHLLVWDEARGEALMCGGTYQASATEVVNYDDVWTWNGSWHRRRPVHSPFPRARSAMAPDPLRGTVVLFGGSGPLADTWTWNGLDWSAQQPANTPPGRALHAMVYDRANNVVLLYGGMSPSTHFSDLWRWNGVDWSMVATTGGPGPRFSHAMAYDEARGLTVLFGGVDASTLTDTWEWTGSSWRATAPATVPAYAGHRMAFDFAAGRVALQSTVVFHWTGNNWVAAPGSPMVFPAIAADPLRGSTLIFPHQVTASGRLALLTATPAAVTAYGTGCANGNVPGIAAIGRPQPGTVDFRCEVQTLAGALPVVFLLGTQSQSVPLGNGCALLVGPPSVAQFAAASATGWAAFSTPIPARNALLGLQVFAQAAVLDPVHSRFAGVTISGGLRIAIGL